MRESKQLFMVEANRGKSVGQARAVDDEKKGVQQPGYERAGIGFEDRRTGSSLTCASGPSRIKGRP